MSFLAPSGVGVEFCMVLTACAPTFPGIPLYEWFADAAASLLNSENLNQKGEGEPSA